MRHVASKTQDNSMKPLTEPVFLILLSLAEQPRHGYALMQDIEGISGGRVRLSTGTLYGAIRRLLDDGWIERFYGEDSSRDKQAYRLTGVGRRVLKEEVGRLRELVRAAGVRMKHVEVSRG